MSEGRSAVVGTAGISQDQKALSPRKALAASAPSPVADGLDGEARRVKAVADTDVAVVIVERINPVWNSLADG